MSKKTLVNVSYNRLQEQPLRNFWVNTVLATIHGSKYDDFNIIIEGVTKEKEEVSGTTVSDDDQGEE